MPHSTAPARRIITIKALIELHRIVYEAAEELDLDAEEFFCDMAVRLGHIENRPMDISSVSETLEIPFATAHRRLKVLRKSGLISTGKQGTRVLHYIPDGEENPAISEAYLKMEQVLTRAAQAITKLDNY